MTYAEATGTSIKDSFDKFDEANPEFYKTFEEQAFRAIERGRKKLSAKLLVNWIRWNIFMTTEDEHSPFKVNDAYHTHFARKFVNLHPKYEDYFNFRRLRS